MRQGDILGLLRTVGGAVEIPVGCRCIDAAAPRHLHRRAGVQLRRRFPGHDRAGLLLHCTFRWHPPRQSRRAPLLADSLCIVYFMGGYDKLGSSWFAGEAVWKALHLPGYAGVAHPLVAVLPAWPPLWAAVGTAVVLIELSYPVGVWFRRSRRAVLAAIIGLHLGIALFLGLYYFSALMVVLHVAAFIAPYTNGLQPVAHPIHSPPGGKYARTLAPDGETGPPTGLPVP